MTTLRACNKTNLMFFAVTIALFIPILLTTCDGPGKSHGW